MPPAPPVTIKTYSKDEVSYKKGRRIKEGERGSSYSSLQIRQVFLSFRGLARPILSQIFRHNVERGEELRCKLERFENKVDVSEMATGYLAN